MNRRFRDRIEAGRLLGVEVEKRIGRRDDAIVLALPRGGVPVGFEVANSIGAPLDVFIVRKLGLPGHEELAMGAIASGGVQVLNDEVLGWTPMSRPAIDAVAERERRELERREREYRGDRPPINVQDKTVIIVDDGLATGSTMRAAIRALQKMKPRAIVVAVPVGAVETCAALATEVDDMICLRMPQPFDAVGMWYSDFSQTSDEEVHDILRRA